MNDNTPVIIGVGEASERIDAADYKGLSPADILERPAYRGKLLIDGVWCDAVVESRKYTLQKVPMIVRRERVRKQNSPRSKRELIRKDGLRKSAPIRNPSRT